MLRRPGIVCVLCSLAVVGGAATAAACPPARESASAPASEAPTAGTAATWASGSDFSHLISVEVSNYDSDCNPWLTEDEQEIFFIRYSGKYGPADAEHQGSWDIYHAEWDPVNDTWGPATNLGPSINSAGADRRPTTTVTGDTLFFSRGGISVSIRTAGEYGPATTLFAGSDPCLSRDGQQLYFARNNDIWVAERGPSGAIDDWVNLHALGPPVNTAAAEVRPYISRDGTMLFFSDFGGSRPGGYGGADLWVSTWTGASWGEPENVGPPINVDRPACTPWLSADARRLYASSESFEGSRGCEDIWIAHRDSTVDPAEIVAPPGTWTKLGELDGAWNVYDLEVDATGTLYAATSPAGRVYRSGDGGNTWTVTDSLPGALIAHSLLVSNDGTLYAGTYPNGDVFRSSDGGATWQPTANLPGATAVRALLETSDGRVLAGTSPLCRIFATTDGGVTWTPLGATFGMNSSVSVLFEASDGTLFAGGWGRPNMSTNGGVTWIPFFEFGGMGCVESFLEASDGTLWMTGWGHDEGGYVASSTDGLSWAWAGQVTVDSVRAVRVYDIVETADGRVIVGFQPGPGRVACISSDGGASWTPESSLEGAHEILRFLETDSGAIYAATTPNGDIFRWTPEVVGVVPDDPGAELPGVAAVLGGTPNPFRSQTAVAYQVPRNSDVHLSIVDAHGRHVRTLEDGFISLGTHTVTWDGTGPSGSPVASGVYFVKLRAGESVTFQKLVLIR